MISTLLSLLLMSGAVHCDDGHNEYRIRKAKDLVTFSEEVNSGSTFVGTTVILDSDLTFNEELSLDFEPIGKSSTNYFQGVFDGQGYLINDLALEYHEQYVGLFGYTHGVTLRNIVLGTSTVINATHYGGTSTIYVGGILGHCDAFNSDCTIKSVLSLGSVTANNAEGTAHVGGLVGYLQTYYSLSPSQLNYALLRDSAHYGAISFNKLAPQMGYIGGLVGTATGGGDANRVRLENCLSAGTITNGDSASHLVIGGIIGTGSNTFVENCVASCVLEKNVATSENSVGGIAGDGDVASNNSFWVDESFGSSGDEYATLSEDMVTDINIYASTLWNSWVYNPGKKALTFAVTSGERMVLSASLVQLPGLEETGWRHFLGWYSDAALTTPFTGHSVAEDTTLYGLWDKYLVTLDAAGGSVSQTYFEVSFGARYPALPEPTKTKATFYGWYTEENGSGDKASKSVVCTRAFDHTLYAHWVTRTFYVTFVKSAGDNTTNEVIYTDTIQYPAAPEREGYRFIGWDQNVTVMPDHNLTINAVWEEITRTVELAFVSKDGEMEEEELRKLLGTFTDDEGFVVKSAAYEKKAGLMRVVVKFSGKDFAEKFVENVENADKSVIEVSEIEYVQEESFSVMAVPRAFGLILFLLYLFNPFF